MDATCDDVEFMHKTLHVETHFEATDTVRDVVIGMSDGLTVPFALAAGLTGTAMATTSIVVIAGLAEIAAGSIAMGLGGYLAARTDRDHYESERQREYRETVELPEKDHPARKVIEEHKLAQRARLVGLCRAARLTEPEMLADELHLLLEGARVTAQSVGADGLGARLLRMGEAMIAAHAPRSRPEA